MSPPLVSTSIACEAVLRCAANCGGIDTVQALIDDEQPTTPPRSMRLTRRQLAKKEEDFSRSLRSHGPPQPEQVGIDTTVGAAESEAVESQEQSEDEVEDITIARSHPEVINDDGGARDDEALGFVAMATVEEPAPTAVEPFEPEIGTPFVEVTEPEPKVLASEKPFDEDATPATSVTPSRAISRSSTRSASRTPMRLEESIGAIDALEEALEDVGRSLPSFDQLADDKSPRKARFARTATPSKTSKSAGRPSMAALSGNPSLAPKSMKPNGLSRASSVRAPPKDRSGSGEVVDYLASKRRPISMTFAPPPPPTRSTKAPTTSDFQLPGERIAAELKAKKEERLKRMAEAGPVKQRPLSMPPPPKSSKPPTKSDFQLPGERIAAELKAKKEERLKRLAEGEPAGPRKLNLPAPPKSSKPPTIPNFQLPGEKLAAEQKARKEERLKREAEEDEAARKATFKARPAPKRNSFIAPVRQTAASQARLLNKENTLAPTIQPLQRSSSVAANKRNSVVQARSVSTSSSNRSSLILGPTKLQPIDAVALRNKGREVFNRDKLEKESREKERREKEEAAKRARAEAAERGRIASREWAKKQAKQREDAAKRMKEGVA